MRLGNNNFDHHDSAARMANRAEHIFNASDYSRTTIQADTFVSRRDDNFKADIKINYDAPSEESLDDPRYHIDFSSNPENSKRGFFADLFAQQNQESRQESKSRIRSLVNKVKANRQDANPRKSFSSASVRPSQLALA